MTLMPGLTGFLMLMKAFFTMVLFSSTTLTRSAMVAIPASSIVWHQMDFDTGNLLSTPIAWITLSATPAPHRSAKGYVLSLRLAQMTASASGSSS